MTSNGPFQPKAFYDSKTDVLKREMCTLTGQCRAGAQSESISQAELPGNI